MRPRNNTLPGISPLGQFKFNVRRKDRARKKYNHQFVGGFIGRKEGQDNPNEKNPHMDLRNDIQ